MVDIKTQLKNSWIKEGFTFWDSLNQTYHETITIDRKENKALCLTTTINTYDNTEEITYSLLDLNYLSEQELYNMV